MTDDDICHLAVAYDAMSGDVGDLIKFAKAVANKEREACATLVEKSYGGWTTKMLVMAIRARGE